MKFHAPNRLLLASLFTFKNFGVIFVLIKSLFFFTTCRHAWNCYSMSHSTKFSVSFKMLHSSFASGVSVVCQRLHIMQQSPQLISTFSSWHCVDGKKRQQKVPLILIHHTTKKKNTKYENICLKWGKKENRNKLREEFDDEDGWREKELLTSRNK